MFGAPSRYAGPIANGVGSHYRDLDIAARVGGASPHGLIQILFDEAMRAIDTLAAVERSGGRLPAVQSRAMLVLHGLETGLDHDKGGSLAATLAAVYREARRLLATQGSGRAAALGQARTILGEVSTAWAAIG